jgi:hypothetical protein
MMREGGAGEESEQKEEAYDLMDKMKDEEDIHMCLGLGHLQCTHLFETQPISVLVCMGNCIDMHSTHVLPRLEGAPDMATHLGHHEKQFQSPFSLHAFVKNCGKSLSGQEEMEK